MDRRVGASETEDATTMENITVVRAIQGGDVGQRVRVNAWVRTRRDSKAGFSFLELNDGSCMSNLQVIADQQLANYEAEIKRLTSGCSVTVEGELKDSAGKEQATELHAEQVVVHGWADPEEYPLQKKRHSFEKLREWAHLRPRTNTFGAVARVRNQVSMSIHSFFQEEGFLYVHTPVITASDCEGAGELFRVTTTESGRSATQRWRHRLHARFLRTPQFLDGERAAGGRNLRHGLGKSLYVRPHLSSRKLQYLPTPG